MSRKQQQCYHVKAAKEHKNRAHKRVTKFYATEKKNPRGEEKMLSETIARQIQKDYDKHGPRARDIRRYVNDYGLVGSSLIGPGTKGIISRWVLNTLWLTIQMNTIMIRLVSLTK